MNNVDKDLLIGLRKEISASLDGKKVIEEKAFNEACVERIVLPDSLIEIAIV